MSYGFNSDKSKQKINDVVEEVFTKTGSETFKDTLKRACRRIYELIDDYDAEIIDLVNEDNYSFLDYVYKLESFTNKNYPYSSREMQLVHFGTAMNAGYETQFNVHVIKYQKRDSLANDVLNVGSMDMKMPTIGADRGNVTCLSTDSIPAGNTYAIYIHWVKKVSA